MRCCHRYIIRYENRLVGSAASQRRWVLLAITLRREYKSEYSETEPDVSNAFAVLRKLKLATAGVFLRKILGTRYGLVGTRFL